MKIDVTTAQPTIDARDLAPLLGLAPDQIQTMMRAGDITSLHEQGQGTDAGRFRLTFTHGTRRVRLTCAADGTVLSTIKTTAP